MVGSRLAWIMLLGGGGLASGQSADATAPPAAAVDAGESPERGDEIESLLTRENLGEWRAKVAAQPEELEWLDVGWLPQLGMAVAATEAEPRPILLWAMNGHPLGCT